MSGDAKQILDSIDGLVKAKDAAALVGLRDHADKKVRKAVRKALHTLETRGVEIPDAAAAKAWTVGDALEQLRGDLSTVAIVDTRTIPGALRFMLSVAEEGSGFSLFAGTIGPTDRVLEFNAYGQSDGQRARMVRDWESKVGQRRVPENWLEGRIRWARDKTIASGFSVPPSLDQVLSRLGDAPSERPGCFLELPNEAPFAEEDIDDVLAKAGVSGWPPLVDLDSTLQKAAEIHGDKPQPTEDKDRVELLMKSIEGDENVREALKGTLGFALEDVAVHLWLEDEAAPARKLLDMANALREADEPEALPWVARLVGFQVASLLRVVGEQQKQQAAAAQRSRPA